MLHPQEAYMSWIIYIFIPKCHIEIMKLIFVYRLLIKIDSKTMPGKKVSIINLYIYFLLFYILLSNTDLKSLAIYFKSIER